MNRPAETDIEAARAYLRLRLEAERSMTYHLELLLREAAERILAILYEAGIVYGRELSKLPELSEDNLPPKAAAQIQEVIQWLKETIDDYFLTLAIYDHEENKDRILPLILSKSHGQTFSERLADYCEKYRQEILLLAGAGLFLGMKQAELARSIGAHLRKPYHNPDLADAIAAPLTYGRGHTNSMFTAIDRLTKFGIGRAWMLDRHIKAEIKSAAGFFTFRNSSVPCSICDDYAAYPHPLDDPLPPLHANCVCGTIYFNHEGDFLRI